jgi:FixJ family two-component response regulator
MAMPVPYVAVVDDELPVRTALGRLLRLADYDVAIYASGDVFLSALDARRPECVVLDIHMPGLTGFDVQMRLKAAHANVPVVFITASDDPDLGRQVLEAGGAQLLRKPFTNDALLAAIGAALRDKPSVAKQ